MYKRTPIEKRLRRRGRIWSFWAYDYRGKQYTASTHQTDRAAALEAARHIERERAVPPTHQTGDVAQAYTLAQALGLVAAHDARIKAAPNTIEFHVNRGRHLVQGLGADCMLDDIKAKLDAYVDKRQRERADDSTIAKELRVLRQAARHALDGNHWAGDPKRLAVEGLTKEDVYEPGDVWLQRVEWLDALIAHTSTNPDQHRIDRKDDLLVIVNMGLRRRELLMVQPEHVNMTTRILSVRKRGRKRERKRGPRKAGLKTKKSQRELPLNDLMVEVLTPRLRGARLGQPLFTNWGSGNR